MSVLMPTFSTWTHENLAKFAEESYARIVNQAEQIEFLQRDKKDAIEAYRSLMRKSAPLL
jgi:hypothetical protein